jgi:hypothetical protein
MTKKALKVTLHPDCMKQLRSYVNQLISLAKCTTDQWEEEDPGTGETYLQGPIIIDFEFDQRIFDKIVLLLKDIDYVNARELRDLFETYVRVAFDRVMPENAGTFNVSDVVANDHLDNLKASLMETLASLPWQYEILIPLIGVALPGDASKPLHLSKNIKLFKMTEGLRSIEYGVIKDTRNKENSILGIQLGVTIPLLGITYLSILSSGFNFSYTTSMSFRNTMRNLKITLATLIAYGILQEEHIEPERELVLMNPDYEFGLTPNDQECCYVYPKSRVEKPFSLKLPTEDWNFLYRLAMDKQAYEPSEYDLALVGRGATSTPEARWKNLEAKVSSFRKVLIDDFESGENDEVERVRAALEWFYEGMANRNATFSYVQLSIALEALLGEPFKKKRREQKQKKEYKGNPEQTEGVVQRLRDRCAYLIADDPNERRDIMQRLDDAYDVRSKIVHSGRQILDKEDQTPYQDLKQFLMRSLAKEVRLLPNLP